MSRFVLIALSLASLASCTTAPAPDGGGDGGGGADPRPDGMPATDKLDPADCTAFAQSMVAAASSCGTPLPGGAQSTFEGLCKKGVDAAALCGGDPAAGLDCFATPDASDWACIAGEPYPACGGDLSAALGAYCLIALGNPQCATGVKCTYDADCSTGFMCNSAIDQCTSESAYCVGLPCVYDADCPSGHRCNSTEGACLAD